MVNGIGQRAIPGQNGGAMTFSDAMRRLMAERGMSLGALAKAVPCDKGYLSRVANGIKPPSERIAERLDELLAANGELVALSSKTARQRVLTDGPSTDKTLVPSARTPVEQTGSVVPTGTDHTEDDVRRRIFLALMGATAAKRLSENAETLRLSFNSVLGSAPTERDADAWERVAHDYAHEVGFLPASQLLPDLLADFDEIRALVERSAGPVQKQLLLSSAQLAALTAITFVNLGDARGARRWWRTAARAADESGNHLVASLIRGRQAVFSLYEPRPNPSILRVAAEAIEIGRDTPCAGVASGYAARAQALAIWGRHDEAQEALKNSKRYSRPCPTLYARTVPRSGDGRHNACTTPPATSILSQGASNTPVRPKTPRSLCTRRKTIKAAVKSNSTVQLALYGRVT